MSYKKTAEYALVYMTECALATAATEYWKQPADRRMNRQELNLVISRAQQGMTFIKKLGLTLTNYEGLLADYDHDAKVVAVQRAGGNVKAWLQVSYALVQDGPYGSGLAKPLV